MANIENLKPMEYELSREEAKKGGIKSGQVRKEKKLMKDCFKLLMSLPSKNDKLKSQIKSLGIEDEDITNQMAVTISMFQQALKGNVRASEFIRDTMGEKPKDIVDNNIKVGKSSIDELISSIDNIKNENK